MARNLPVNSERISADLAALAQLTEPGRPWTRRAFTPMFLRGRKWLEARMRAAGLETRIDDAGNLIGHLRGRKPELGTLMVGSHSDTVPNGGRFDGIAGVVAGLEIARSIKEAGVHLDHNLEIVDFLAEEVSIFGVSCVGSRGMTGQRPDEWLTRQFEGRSLTEAIAEVGGVPGSRAKRTDIAGFLELHIEQGPVLEATGDAIGVVTAIAGITRITVDVSGRADHAGTTPMDRRNDALTKASELVLAVRDKAKEIARGPGYFTATVGEFSISPGAANVIPSSALMLIDARAARREDMERFVNWLRGAAPNFDATVKVISDNPPSPSDADMCAALEAASDRLGAKWRSMVSGAGHDTAWLAKVAPAAMIFVPCKDGRSHTPEEWAETEDISLGAAVLFETLKALDERRTQTTA